MRIIVAAAHKYHKPVKIIMAGVVQMDVEEIVGWATRTLEWDEASARSTVRPAIEARSQRAIQVKQLHRAIPVVINRALHEM
eukprot:COSAG05_NODE_4072_length_1686_cov_3.850662_2_plen_82_part_00